MLYFYLEEHLNVKKIMTELTLKGVYMLDNVIDETNIELEKIVDKIDTYDIVENFLWDSILSEVWDIRMTVHRNARILRREYYER